MHILLESKPEVILVNIFGGITKADTVAEGMQRVIDETHTNIPVVARVKGVYTRSPEEIIDTNHIHMANTLPEAVQKVVELVKGGR